MSDIMPISWYIADMESTSKEEEEDFTCSDLTRLLTTLAHLYLGCTDVPGLSITWSKTSVLSVYHV